MGILPHGNQSSVIRLPSAVPTMNRLDPVSGQLVAPPERRGALPILLWASWCVPAASVALAVWLAASQSYNLVDLVAQTAADLNLTVMLVDLWALSLAVFRRSSRSPLRVPVRTPLLLAGAHLLLWLVAIRLSSFDGLYRLESVDEAVGRYLVSGWAASGLVLVALASIVSAGLEVRLVRWVLISESTAVSDVEAPTAEGSVEADMPAGGEHLYEAQMVLHELGFSPGEVDGKMSPSTEEALKRFQMSCGLAPSGEITVLTLVELRNHWAEKKQSQG